ncbi:MAG: ATP-binding cassette domain-containing protein, partial [Ignavibacteriae bacterium]|nr:ATP-binding cassette domain-containing protein [Ignavibacteriota bacterium]
MGAGKTTALNVLLGLTAASEGTVTIGGTDLADVDLVSWWSQV